MAVLLAALMLVVGVDDMLDADEPSVTNNTTVITNETTTGVHNAPDVVDDDVGARYPCPASVTRGSRTSPSR